MICSLLPFQNYSGKSKDWYVCSTEKRLQPQGRDYLHSHHLPCNIADETAANAVSIQDEADAKTAQQVCLPMFKICFCTNCHQ